MSVKLKNKFETQCPDDKIDCNYRRAEVENNIQIAGEGTWQVRNLKNLVPTKTANTNCSGAIMVRINIANRRIIELQDLWRDKNLTTL